MCDFPRCNNEGTIKYLHSDICAHHWDRLCNEFNKGQRQENNLLKKINMYRDKNGMVRPISKQDLTK